MEGVIHRQVTASIMTNHTTEPGIRYGIDSLACLVGTAYPSLENHHLEGPAFITIRYERKGDGSITLDPLGKSFIMVRWSHLVDNHFSGSGPAYSKAMLDEMCSVLQALKPHSKH